MAKEAYQYRGRSAEDVARRAKSGALYDSYIDPDIPMYKAREGENRVRIMPPTWGDNDTEKWGLGWEIRVFLHYDVGPDSDSYLCLDKMNSERCPICEARLNSTDSDEKDKLKPSSRHLAWIIDRENERNGPVVWSLPGQAQREINNRSTDKKTGKVILVDHPEHGYDLSFTRDGTGLKTKYTSFDVDRDPAPLATSEKQQDRWLEYIQDNPLPSLLRFYDAEHIEKILFGRGGKKRAEDQDQKPEGRSRRGSAPEVDEGAVRGSRRLAREEDDQQDAAPLARRRPEPEPEAEERPARRRPVAEEEGDNPLPDVGTRTTRRRDPEPEPERPASRRRLPEPEPDAAEEDEAPSAQAKAAMERMKERRTRG